MLERIVAGWAIAGGLVLLAIVLVTATNVGLYIADALAPGTVRVVSGYEDIVRLLVSAAALMMLPHCQLRRGHVAVDVFTERLRPTTIRAIERVIHVLMAATALFLGYWMVFGMLETWTGGLVSPVLNWPEWPFYLPGLVSLGLWAVVAAEQLRASVDRGRS
jgi:TRAP-type C4-dicarboxylate transport system permease small subunit